MSLRSPLFAIAGNTLREAIRSRVLYTLLFFAFLMIGSGALLATLSYIDRERILQDLGLSAIRLFGVAIAIFFGVSLIYKEVDRRTIYTLLSKPVSRSEFLLGKYFGLVATLWLQLAIMSLAFVLISWMANAPLHSGHAWALLLCGVEFALLCGVATFFSAFTTPMLASLFSVGIFVLGNLSRDLRSLGEQSDSSTIANITDALFRLLPDLQSFNLRIEAVHALPIDVGVATAALAYGLFYAAILLLLASCIFAGRDFR